MVNNPVMILLVWNILVMFVYGIDKMQAKKGGRRISEKMLLSYAFLLGGWGAMFGMVLFHHKTSKPKFRFLVPLAVLVGMAMLYILFDKSLLVWYN